MALIDDIQTLLRTGAAPHEIKQALRQAEDLQQVSEHDVNMPDIPALGPLKWAALKAKLQSPLGPNNLYQMLVMLHAALDADDQPNCWRAIFGICKAAWSQHPGLRQDLRNARPPVLP